MFLFSEDSAIVEDLSQDFHIINKRIFGKATFKPKTSNGWGYTIMTTNIKDIYINGFIIGPSKEFLEIWRNDISGKVYVQFGSYGVTANSNYTIYLF